MVGSRQGAGTGRLAVPEYETRYRRERRGFWQRLAIWIFLVFFALSTVGIGLVAIFTQR